MPKITLSRAHPPRLLLGWERRVYPRDVVLRRRLCDPRILAAYDALRSFPRILSNRYAVAEYWDDRHLGRALLRDPATLALLPDARAFALEVARVYGYMPRRTPHHGVCCSCGWTFRSEEHQQHCYRERKARKRLARLEKHFELGAHPTMPGALRATLVCVTVKDGVHRSRITVTPYKVFLARPGLGDFYNDMVWKIGRFRAARFWRAYALTKRLRPYLAEYRNRGRADRLYLLRELAPALFHRLPVAPIRAH